ncbi:uncharacterized protein CDAR_484851 [Caerostris darwini]|uniref:Uncharacterized protein n=1 Tax=Caerostris darwini TaxID=1538125 RepID=A0AAV4SB23_9ARAC|nr:uncharacterized protein CDAR_484851 [Caerostris darwini]
MAPGARFSHYDGAEKHRNDMHKYVGSYKGDLGYFHDRPFPTSELGAKFEYADLVQNGFVPQDISELNHVNWWKKRFQGKMLLNSRVLPSKDNKLPNNNFIYMMPTGIKKRDYTAAQLVNMLKALAKARRQRQIRITGKGLRFGISK